jgi:hypothetical protein
MAEVASRAPSQPAAVLGLTFLVIGLTFALPYKLVPTEQVEEASKFWASEVANVYACAAWAGWAHFIFAFRGQAGALARIKDGFSPARFLAYACCVLFSIVILYLLRSAMGVALFGAIVWVYFIDHFIKAERSFEGQSTAMRWLNSYQTLIAFSWLSVILLDIANVGDHRWVIWTVSLMLALVMLVCGGWNKLANGDERGPLLSLFFIAEALVWGTFGQFGGPNFLAGVYVFHIAAGSYFHYFGSYFFANAKSQGKDRYVSAIVVVSVNVAVVGLGFAVVRIEGLSWLVPLLGIQWFTLWVGLHLVVSDLFLVIKAWRLAKT